MFCHHLCALEIKFLDFFVARETIFRPRAAKFLCVCAHQSERVDSGQLHFIPLPRRTQSGWEREAANGSVIELTAEAFPFSICLLKGPAEVQRPRSKLLHTHYYCSRPRRRRRCPEKKLINIACAGQQQQRSHHLNGRLLFTTAF